MKVSRICLGCMSYGKPTERDVVFLRLVARGLNNPEIASRMHLSEGTVRNHLSAILAKLDVTNRTQAAVIAIQPGLGERKNQISAHNLFES